MAEILLFHHAQGLTPGVVALADTLREEGHTVHTPDLYDGQAFPTLEEGMAHAQSVGFQALLERGVAQAAELPEALVYAGFSLGAMPAQKLAQTRPGALGALLFHAAIPISGEWAFGPWPDGVPAQIHGMDADPIFVGEGDVDAAREIVAAAPEAELFLYPGDQHFFADNSLPSYDAEATALLTVRVLDFLDRVDRPWEPPLAGTEREHLIGALDRMRATFRWKVDGLDAAGLSLRAGASTLTLGGLLKHLALVEDYSSTSKLSGAPLGEPWPPDSADSADETWEFTSAAQDSPAELYALWDGAVERARARFATALAEGGLDRPAHVADGHGRHASVRRLLCDLIEEYGRHTGHADLLREAVDGLVGEDPPRGWRPERG